MPVIIVGRPEEQQPTRRRDLSASFELKSIDFPPLSTRVLSPQYYSAAEPAQSWSDMIQHGLRPRPSFARFLDLPKEIRSPIWTLAFPFIGQVAVRDAVKRGDDPKKPGLLPVLCFTSKKTFEETVVSFIIASKILVCSYNDNLFLRAFLEAEKGRFEQVRQLDFEFFSRYEGNTTKNADLELAVQCTGLRIIKLGFHKEELTYYRLVDDSDMLLQCSTQPYKATDLFSKYKLERLLDCDMLETIIIEHSGYFSLTAEAVAEELGAMLRGIFGAKVSKQVIEVVYTRKGRRARQMYDW
ncbi:hypothetical protein AA0119_g10513 [Alternaria tenuissima]|jgi:hypothetical protein|uniref:Uncharacterized protein n=1 Tax=Alternaria tenuissima TaxID=119927 RepID=A0ABY0G0C4_9PLEO|nr:hypothetical protein AA0119_g10513 [Alternaria tenuissima]RYO07740.1 hypothetical protein AA0121_g11593 [Alternaria tenuissima]